MSSLSKFHLQPNLDDIEVRRECLSLIQTSANIGDLTTKVMALIDSIENDSESARRAINIALPLVYRFGLDDSRKGLMLGSEIKERACEVLFPDFSKCLHREIDHIYRTWCKTTLARADHYLNRILKEIENQAKGILPSPAVYGRKKTPYSVYEKILGYTNNRKSPKQYELSTAAGLATITSKFHANMLACLEDKPPRYGYSREPIAWLIPDLLGCTIQFGGELIQGKNLGSTKAKYRKVYRYLADHLNAEVFFGPSYSSKWHMNRLAFYTIFRFGQLVKIPTEIFIRTDYDYFIGYVNYWQYKGVDLLKTRAPSSEKSRAGFIRRMKQCKSFEEAQDWIFSAVVSGQMPLF